MPNQKTEEVLSSFWQYLFSVFHLPAMEIMFCKMKPHVTNCKLTHPIFYEKGELGKDFNEFLEVKYFSTRKSHDLYEVVLLSSWVLGFAYEYLDGCLLLEG